MNIEVNEVLVVSSAISSGNRVYNSSN